MPSAATRAQPSITARVDADQTPYPSPVTAWTMVAALFIAYIFSFIDRMLIGLLVEPIKADLGLTDTQISLLQGLAFAIFYTAAGIPLGRWIDRTVRTRAVAAGIAVWSGMTVLCGMATNFWLFFLARMGVGVGEAVLSPAAYSIISDSFPQRRLGLAIGVYGLGSAVGAGLAFIIGAVVIALVAETGTIALPLLGLVKGWQIAFFAAAAVTVGAGPSTIQQLAPNRMRATVSAFYVFVVNVIGLAIGPTLTAAIGDTFFPGGDGIRYAISITAASGYAIATILFLVAIKPASVAWNSQST